MSLVIFHSFHWFTLGNIHSNLYWLVVNCDVIWYIGGPNFFMTLVNKWGTVLWRRRVPSPFLCSLLSILLFLHAAKITSGWNLELAVDLKVRSGVAWCKGVGEPWQNWLITKNIKYPFLMAINSNLHKAKNVSVKTQKSLSFIIKKFNEKKLFVSPLTYHCCSWESGVACCSWPGPAGSGWSCTAEAGRRLAQTSSGPAGGTHYPDAGQWPGSHGKISGQ